MKALMYHYVKPTSEEYPHLFYLHLDDFKRQLDFFQENYHILSQAEFEACLDTHTPHPNGLILTFDDGLRDHFQYVAPELIKRNLWGIFYVTTGVHETKKLLPAHRVHHLLGTYDSTQMLSVLEQLIEPHMLKKEHSQEYNEKTYHSQENNAASTRFRRILNYLLEKEWQSKLLDQLMAEYSDEATLYNAYYMNREMIKSLDESGLTVGSHTVTHPLMAELNREQQQAEITNSFRWLEQAAGKKPSLKTFCYPYGHAFTFNETTKHLLEEIQCKCAFSFDQRDITTEHLAHDKQALPRYDCNSFPYGKSRRALHMST